MQPISPQYIVVTSPLPGGEILKKQLEKEGFKACLFPTISLRKKALTKDVKKQLSTLSTYDWIIFTSRNGVRFFMEALSSLKIDSAVLAHKRIAAVGPKTADEIKKYHLPLQFIPSLFTTADLARELPDIRGEKILLPRARIATPLLTQILEAKGARVVHIPIYETDFTHTSSAGFEELLEKGKVGWIFFTSPSTVHGFLKSTHNCVSTQKIFSLPVLAIGPVTAAALKKEGFTTIYTAEIFTREGMITKLKEIIL